MAVMATRHAISHKTGVLKYRRTSQYVYSIHTWICHLCVQPFHSLKVRIKTDKKQFEFKDDETGYSAVGQAISNSGLDNEQESQRVSHLPVKCSMPYCVQR